MDCDVDRYRRNSGAGIAAASGDSLALLSGEISVRLAAEVLDGEPRFGRRPVSASRCLDTQARTKENGRRCKAPAAESA